MSDVITGGKTVFENKLFDGLLTNKDREFRDSGHVYTFVRDFHTYEFRIDGNSINAGLPKKITIYGPVYERASKPKHPMSFLGYLDVETGKIKAGRTSGRDKTQTEDAVDYWLRKRAGISLDQLGWDASLREGWGHIYRRIPGKSHMRDVCIIAAAMPARHIDEYDPSGKRLLGYDERMKLKIPAGVLAYVRARFEDENIFEDLYQSYRTVNRRVSAWEDGPGYKHFHKAA